MSYDWQSDAWRNSYDAWKTREPDYYDDDPPDEEPVRPFVYQPRMTWKREAENRALGNRAAMVAWDLARVREYLARVGRSRDTADNLKSYARGHLVIVRKMLSTHGPVCRDVLIEVPF